MTLPASRTIFWLVFLGTVFLMAVALFMQHVMNLQPCPLCTFQRVMVIATGIVALIAALHNPRETGIRIYGVLMSLTAIMGAAIAIRHLWLQSLPADQVPACGPDLNYLLDVFPITEVLSKVLMGDGTCAEVLWTLFGISIPGWTLVAFVGLLALGILQVVRPPSTSR